jgi:fructan beta-fructosidase
MPYGPAPRLNAPPSALPLLLAAALLPAASACGSGAEAALDREQPATAVDGESGGAAIEGEEAGTPQATAGTSLSDPHRPLFHFTPRSNWINDPNGPIRVGGLHHLFFQYNPGGNVWGNIGWGHAVSTDLLQWEERSVAIPRTDSTMIFSGGVVADSLGTSGLCTGSDCLVAIYTSAHEATRAQNQSLAFSTDGGESWRQYQENPVLDIGSTEFRDPWVFWHGASEAWVMAVAMAVDHTVRFYRSPDLRNWEHASDFGPLGGDGGVWECPVLMELPVEGDDAGGSTRWLLKVDLGGGHVAGGSGAQYFVGDFDGSTFEPEPQDLPRWVDHGPDFYCAQPWSVGPMGAGSGGEAGVTWIAWMSNWAYANHTPTAPWRGAMSLPRTVSLRTNPDGGHTLVQRPIPALEGWRGARQEHRVLHEPIADATPVPHLDPGDTFEMMVRLRPGDAGEVGILLRHSPEEHILLSYDPIRERVALDRRPVPGHTFHAAFPSRAEAPLPPGADGTVVLRVVVDRSSVELFGGEGSVVISSLVFPDPGSRGIALFTKGGAVESLVLELWPLRPPGE